MVPLPPCGRPDRPTATRRPDRRSVPGAPGARTAAGPRATRGRRGPQRHQQLDVQSTHRIDRRPERPRFGEDRAQRQVHDRPPHGAQPGRGGPTRLAPRHRPDRNSGHKRRIGHRVQAVGGDVEHPVAAQPTGPGAEIAEQPADVLACGRAARSLGRCGGDDAVGDRRKSAGGRSNPGTDRGFLVHHQVGPDPVQQRAEVGGHRPGQHVQEQCRRTLLIGTAIRPPWRRAPTEGGSP